MNREILFRGKRATNGEWLYGDLLQSKCDDTTYAYIRSETVLRVDPSTVGQFTELIDKNGVKIFEGDIVQTREIGQLVVGNTYTGADRIRRGVVRYIGGAFEVIYDSSIFGHEMDDDEPENVMDLSAAYFMYGATVVGNIYDNPELLNA